VSRPLDLALYTPVAHEACSEQIADFLSVDRTSVVKFFQSVYDVHAARPSRLRPVLQLRTDMFRKFFWAFTVIAIVLLFSAFIDFRAMPSLLPW
jgi:hypothetical protein